MHRMASPSPSSGGNKKNDPSSSGNGSPCRKKRNPVFRLRNITARLLRDEHETTTTTQQRRHGGFGFTSRDESSSSSSDARQRHTKKTKTTTTNNNNGEPNSGGDEERRSLGNINLTIRTTTTTATTQAAIQKLEPWVEAPSTPKQETGGWAEPSGPRKMVTPQHHHQQIVVKAATEQQSSPWNGWSPFELFSLGNLCNSGNTVVSEEKSNHNYNDYGYDYGYDYDDDDDDDDDEIMDENNNINDGNGPIAACPATMPFRVLGHFPAEDDASLVVPREIRFENPGLCGGCTVLSPEREELVIQGEYGERRQQLQEQKPGHNRTNGTTGTGAFMKRLFKPKPAKTRPKPEEEPTRVMKVKVYVDPPPKLSRADNHSIGNSTITWPNDEPQWNNSI